MTKDTPMMQQYKEAKRDYPDALVLFQLGDFYELFFEEALLGSQLLGLTLTARTGGGEKIPMCGVPAHAVEGYLKTLVEHGHKVAICEQMTPAKPGQLVERKVVRVVTPGTLLEEDVGAHATNRFLVSVAHARTRWAIAAIDISTGEGYLTEVTGPCQRAWDELAPYQPRELVWEAAEVPEVFLQGLPKDLPRTEVAWTETEPLLPEIQTQVQREPLLERALRRLYHYLGQHQAGIPAHLRQWRFHRAKQVLVMDAATRSHLAIIHNPSTQEKSGSLWGTLDATMTSMGSRLLRTWLQHPRRELAVILRRQAVVAALVEQPMLLSEVRRILKGICDVERLVARLAYERAHARDLLLLAQSVAVLPELQACLGPVAPLQAWVEKLDPCQDVAQRISRALAEDPPLALQEGGLFQRGYHPELDHLREVQEEGRVWIQALEQREREVTGIRSLKVSYNRVFGYYLEVTKANLQHIPRDRYQRKQTLANAERYTTQELQTKERAIMEAQQRSVAWEYEHFLRLRQAVVAEVPRLQQLATHVAALDALQALAHTALEQHYVCPTLTEGERLEIEEGQHPILAASMGHFVPNSLLLDDQQRVALVTGPNMAGKSTYMRQVALLILMAQVGSFVPARQATLPLVDQIFARIGAADDLVGGRSTFMVEMEETNYALRNATPRSLILLDEVGRGTSTYDGLAIAQAILEHLYHQVGAYVLFSTHYHELAQQVTNLPQLQLLQATCTEQEGKLVFLHRIAPGCADRSYGLQVAAKAGLPAGVLTRAQVVLESMENQPTKVVPLASQAREQAVAPEVQQVLEALGSWDSLHTSPAQTLAALEQWQALLSHAKVR